MASLFLLAQGLLAGVFLTRAVGRRRDAPPGASRARAPRTAPGARALLVFHSFGVGLVSLGIYQTLVGGRGRLTASPIVILGTVFVFAAMALGSWALQVFASWRLLAHVDAGHALCTSGPYEFVRHPIYLAMNMWALGTALACPAITTVAGVVIIFIGTDLRSRAEERLLVEVFGNEYRAYMLRVRRLVPGLY